MAFRKIKAGLVNADIDVFVGEVGNLFFDISDGVLRLSDGETPGGVPLSIGGTDGGGGGTYTLPTASTTTKGGVKVDGTTIRINNQVISGFSGSYADLTNKPTLFSGNYDDLTNKPTVPTNTSQLTNSAGFITNSALSGYATESFVNGRGFITDVPEASASIKGGIKIGRGLTKNADGTVDGFSGSYTDLTNKPTLFSGSYNDLTNKPTLITSYTQLTDKPTIPTDISQLSDNNNVLSSSGAGYSLPKASNSILGGIKIGSGLTIDADGIVSVTVLGGVTSYTQLTDLPSLFSGSYTDLTNKPTSLAVAPQWTANHTLLPGGENTRYLAGDAVYDNGSIYVANFDNESLPTSNTQYWTNIGTGKRLNFDGRDIPNITYDQLSGKPTLFSGSYNDLTNKPTIPSDTGDLTNNAGFITISALTGYATETYVTTQGYLTTVSYNDLTDLPTLFSGSYDDLTGLPTLFSGSYEDLTNKPTLVTSYNDLSDTPTLFSGSYADLTNKPTIPVDISDLTDINNRLASNISQDDLFVYALIF